MRDITPPTGASPPKRASTTDPSAMAVNRSRCRLAAPTGSLHVPSERYRSRVPGEAIQVRREGDSNVVSLIGEHDLSTAPHLREALASAAQAGGCVVIDLSHTDFIDSSI